MNARTVYSFDHQRAVGERGEAELDSLFCERYAIAPASALDQRAGIDRWFTSRRRFGVEYKTDLTASKTGNAFIETISVDRERTRGWAYTSRAMCLAYYLPRDRLVYWWHFAALREQLPRWCETYPSTQVPNRGYATHGVLVPLCEFEAHAQRVISL